MPTEVTQGAAKRIGTWVRGKYQLDEVLGEGGMAVVYAATHRNKKRFAVKMLRSDFVSAESMRRFLREGYVANSVGHEGAVAVLDDDVADDGSAFLVMELLDGENVEALADRRGRVLPPPTVLAIAHHVLDVLAAAHAKGIVHRDVKPANVFVTREGRIKVLDFGIARLRDPEDGASATRTGVTMGTPSFMAPEQARGKASQISEATDVWALGATMFTLLSGRHVHEGESPQELVVSAATVPPRSLASVCEVPEPVVRLVDRALAFEAADRWPSAAAMRDAVAAIHVELYGGPIPSSIDCSEPVVARGPDPRLGVDADEPPRPATVPLVPKTQLVSPIAEAFESNTGEPVSHPGHERERVSRRVLVAVALLTVVAAVVATVGASFAIVRRSSSRTAAADPASPPPSAAASASASPAGSVSTITPPASVALEPITVPTPSASASVARLPKPPRGVTSAKGRPSDWDRQ